MENNEHQDGVAEDVLSADAAIESEEHEKTASWLDDLPEDLRGAKELGKYKSIDELAKGHVSQSRFIGSSVRLPNEKSTPEEREAFLNDTYNKLGRPEKPEGYVYDKPEMPSAVQYNEPVVKEFSIAAHKAGFTQDQLKMALDFHNKYAANSFYEHERVGKEAEAKAEAELKQEWGERGFKNNLDAARKVLRVFADKKDIDYINAKGYGNDPSMIRLFANISRKMSESNDHAGNTVEQNFHDSVSAKKEIAAVRSDPKHRLNKAYMNGKDPQHKESMDYLDQLYKLAE